MNPMLKIAHELGCRKALLDAQLIKEADFTPGEATVLNALLPGVGPIIAGAFAPEDRGWSRFGHNIAGGTIGGTAGAVGGSVLGALLGGRTGAALGAGLGGGAGGLYGIYKGQERSRSYDPVLDKLVRGGGLEA